jgi:hypothetical protein
VLAGYTDRLPLPCAQLWGLADASSEKEKSSSGVHKSVKNVKVPSRQAENTLVFRKKHFVNLRPVC